MYLLVLSKTTLEQPLSTVWYLFAGVTQVCAIAFLNDFLSF